MATTADSRFTASMASKVAHGMLRERLRDRRAGIVHQDVAPTERGDGIAQRCMIGDIGDGVARTEFVGGLLQRDDIAADQRDGGAVGGKPARDGQADSLARRR